MVMHTVHGNSKKHKERNRAMKEHGSLDKCSFHGCNSRSTHGYTIDRDSYYYVCKEHKEKLNKQAKRKGIEQSII